MQYGARVYRDRKGIELEPGDRLRYVPPGVKSIHGTVVEFSMAVVGLKNSILMELDPEEHGRDDFNVRVHPYFEYGLNPDVIEGQDRNILAAKRFAYCNPAYTTIVDMVPKKADCDESDEELYE